MAWSPDGKHIAHSPTEDVLALFPVDGGLPTAVIKDIGRNRGTGLSWSPDGSQLAYVSKGKIWKVPRTGGEPLEVKTGINARPTLIAWSPDGKTIAFEGHTGGDSELWVMENFQ